MPESLLDELSRVYHKLAAESGYDRNEDERMRIAHALQAVFAARCKAAGKHPSGLWVMLDFNPAVPNPLIAFTSSEYDTVPVTTVDEWLQMCGTWHFGNTEHASLSRGVVWQPDHLRVGRVRGWDYAA
jgi:hypothetical protein